MLNGIDHIVVVTPDLDTAIRNFTELGFTVVPGGRHPTGTHNALIGLADGAYIELIAFYQPDPENRWWQFLQAGGGLVDFCMVTDNLTSDAAAFSAAGIPMTDNYPLSRVRPDGYKLDWILAVPLGTRGSTPFLIQDTTPRTERVPKQNNHANGVTGVGKLTIAVSDLSAALAFSKVSGSAGTPITRDDLGGTGVRYTSGKHTFDYLTPTNETGAIANWIARHGNSLYEATLTTSGASRGLIDQPLSFNTHFVLEG